MLDQEGRCSFLDPHSAYSCVVLRSGQDWKLHASTFMFPRTESTVSGLDLHALAPSRSMRLILTLSLDKLGLNLDDSRGF